MCGTLVDFKRGGEALVETGNTSCSTVCYTSVGTFVGAPVEGQSWQGIAQQRLTFGQMECGRFTDDTQMTIALAQSLVSWNTLATCTKTHDAAFCTLWVLCSCGEHDRLI